MGLFSVMDTAATVHNDSGCSSSDSNEGFELIGPYDISSMDDDTSPKSDDNNTQSNRDSNNDLSTSYEQSCDSLTYNTNSIDSSHVESNVDFTYDSCDDSSESESGDEVLVAVGTDTEDCEICSAQNVPEDFLARHKRVMHEKVQWVSFFCFSRFN